MKRKPIIVAIVLMAGVVAYVNAQEPAILKTTPACEAQAASVNRPLISKVKETAKEVKSQVQGRGEKVRKSVKKGRGLVKRVLSRILKGRFN